MIATAAAVAHDLTDQGQVLSPSDRVGEDPERRRSSRRPLQEVSHTIIVSRVALGRAEFAVPVKGAAGPRFQQGSHGDGTSSIESRCIIR